MLSKCFHCNGYYGPSFGQPVCSTCHMFLYPDDALLHSSSFHSHELKVEDGDSGNEEPREPSECPAPNDSDTPAGEAPAANDLIDEPQCSGVPPQHKFPSGVSYFSSEDFGGTGDVGTVPEPATIDHGVPMHHGVTDSHLRAFSEVSDRGVSPHLNRFDMRASWDPESLSDLSLSHVTSESRSTANIHSIPPEVMLVVFQLLDEMSLWSVGQVCRRWQELVRNCSLQWKVFILRRWPLFNAIYNVTDWHKVFTNLIESAPCQLCLFRMPYNSLPQTHEDSWRRKRLSNEQRTLRSDPPEGITAAPLDKMSLHWQASIRGPAGSPYQGGTFFLYIQIPSNYPLSPPLVRFMTRIFHPNVSRHGDIGIDSIQHNWSVAITISKVLVSIQSLLTDPYTKVCMEPRIGEMYDENRPQFERIARAWTWCHAMHDAIDPDSMVSGYMHRLTARGDGSPQNDESFTEDDSIPATPDVSQQVKNVEQIST